MENTEREETAEVFEKSEDIQPDEITEKRKKRRRRDRKPKNRRGLRAALRLLQHAALAVTVFAMIVVAVGTTVQIQSANHSWGGTIEYVSYTPEPGTVFEDSRVFNQILGHAAADIIRFGVVSSQLETEGVFDGGKVVDVTAYNYRSSSLPEKYVTANYRLEDLLKWQKYGFEWTTEEMTEKEAADFLADKTQVTAMDPDSGYRNTSDASYLKSNVESYTTVRDVDTDTAANAEITYAVDGSGFVEDYQPAGALGDHAQALTETTDAAEVTTEYAGEDETDARDDDGGEDGTVAVSYDVLVNRYKTADGKKLEDCVSDWNLYYDLCISVQNAAESLSYNYEEYLTYADYYSMDHSNVRYLIEKKVGDETQYYSNMPAGDSDRETVQKMMRGDENAGTSPTEKFIYYSPADMVYATNTSIEENTIRKILQSYDYAYPESVKIWIGVDTSYPAADAFRQGREYLPNLWMWVATAIVCGLLYLILFLYQTVSAGREYDEAGEKRISLNAFDKIPTEMALLIAFGVAMLAFWIVIVVTELAGFDPTDMEYYREAVHQDWFVAALLGTVFAADLIFTFFFYSLVRRIKARTLYQNSYLHRLLLRLKQFAWKVYDNGGIVMRTWVPYGAFLLFNFVMLVWTAFYADADLLVLLFTCVIDVIVGILLYKDAKERQGIVEGIETIAGGKVEYQIDTEELHGDNKVLANSVNSIGKGIKEAVEISMKDERMKADLITNVSHDIKTPLTSIINYVDLLKRERVDNEKIQGYIRVLDEKSQRLKQLTDDLVEASKITSGNISYHFERINLTELMNQTIGEFSEKFETKNLTTVMNVNTRNVMIEADSRRIWRVMENLFNNVYKYAMPGTRVYVTMDKRQSENQDGAEQIEISIKNISENPLNCRPEELTERFIRGDESRTTEGSGLGLSIAKNLTVAQKGNFEIQLDGDLFKVFLTFPAVGEGV